MPLKLSLRPGERFVLNGAVVENGDRRSTLVLQNRAAILRERDIMQVDDADTPARRIYFPIMMMYLEDENKQEHYDEFVRYMTEFIDAVFNQDILQKCIEINNNVASQEFYKALSGCRELIHYENVRLRNSHS